MESANSMHAVHAYGCGIAPHALREGVRESLMGPHCSPVIKAQLLYFSDVLPCTAHQSHFLMLAYVLFGAGGSQGQFGPVIDFPMVPVAIALLPSGQVCIPVCEQDSTAFLVSICAEID